MSESNKNRRLSKWSNLFNVIIEHWYMKEIEIPGRRFTWSNNQINPTFAKMDRFFVSIEWESLFPLAFINILARDISDHSLLVLELGLKQKTVSRPFKLELCWFLRKDLFEVLSMVWNSFYLGKEMIDRWHNRSRKMRSSMKGWDINYKSFYKNRKRCDTSPTYL